ncbi:MAG: response regulator transcription factor [Acutalibacteraceae bacterium]|nr:response regulator transcription factor [Acutalibacteraceae bacterium]
MGLKIIIADDEKRICELVSDFFRAAGYTSLSAYDGNEAIKVFSENRDAALVILDIMMPEKDGWQVCREIREISDVPIIMLSARSEDFDMLTGFENGADEYVTKPFSPAVLVKRAEALINRSRGEKSIGKVETGLRIDQEAWVAYLDGKPLELTLKEFEILSHLYENRGKVLSRDQLLNAVWGLDFDKDERTVDSHIARLRIKMGEFGAAKLKTVYGIGYKIEV